MTKKQGLSSIAPPPRNSPVMPATKTVGQGERVMINVRISEDCAGYLRMLSAKTRTSQQDLVERAIDLLRHEAGEV